VAKGYYKHYYTGIIEQPHYSDCKSIIYHLLILYNNMIYNNQKCRSFSDSKIIFFKAKIQIDKER